MAVTLLRLSCPIRSVVEFEATAWVPYTARNTQLLEAAQGRSARFITGDYKTIRNTSQMIAILGLSSFVLTTGLPLNTNSLTPVDECGYPNCKINRRMAENGFAPPPLGNFADISYLVEN